MWKKTSSFVSGSKDTLARLGQSMSSGEASASTASAGARCLDKTSETYADRAGISQRDRDAVDKTTSYQVSDEEIEQFLKEGGLGEYAKRESESAWCWQWCLPVPDASKCSGL
jgi:hypothetical protein